MITAIFFDQQFGQLGDIRRDPPAPWLWWSKRQKHWAQV
jgi:hypothetical protein